MPELIVEDANPEEDEALARCAVVHALSPLVTPWPPDTIFIDVAGSRIFSRARQRFEDMRRGFVRKTIGARCACRYARLRMGGRALRPR